MPRTAQSLRPHSRTTPAMADRTKLIFAAFALAALSLAGPPPRPSRRPRGAFISPCKVRSPAKS